MTSGRVGAFGKLPIFADFLRHNAAPLEVAPLDEWFQEGIHLAGQVLRGSWQGAYDAATPRRFLIRAAETGLTFAGVSVPGVDAVGRRYPFAIFAMVGGPAWELEWSAAPIALDGFLGEASDLATRGWRGIDARQLGQRVEALRGPAPAGAEEMRRLRAERLGAVASSDFSRKLSEQEEASALGRVLGALRRALPALSQRSARVCLKLPLPEGIEVAVAVAFWLEAIRRGLGRKARPPVAFWEERAPGSLFISAAGARAFLSWIDPGYEGDHVWDLGAAGPAGDGGNGSLAESPGLSLAEVVARAFPSDGP